MLEPAQSFSSFFAQILKLDQISKVLIHVAEQDQANLFWTQPYTRHLLRQKCLEIHAHNLEVLQAQTGITFDELAWIKHDYTCDLTDFTMRQTIAHHHAYQQILRNPEIADEEFVLFMQDDFLLSKNWIKQVTELIHALSFEDLSSSGIDLNEINFISLANHNLNSFQRYTHPELLERGVVYNTYINIYGSGQLLRTDTINTPHLGCYLVRKRALRSAIAQEWVVSHPAFDISHAIAFRPREFAYFNPVIAISTHNQQQFGTNCYNLSLQLLAVCQLLWQGKLQGAEQELAPELLLLLQIRGVLDNLYELITPTQCIARAHELWHAQQRNTSTTSNTTSSSNSTDSTNSKSSNTPTTEQLEQVVRQEITRLQHLVRTSPVYQREHLLQLWNERCEPNQVHQELKEQMQAWFANLSDAQAVELVIQARSHVHESVIQLASWTAVEFNELLVANSPYVARHSHGAAPATFTLQGTQPCYKYTHMDMGRGYLRLTHLYPPHVAFFVRKQCLTDNLHKARLLNYQHNLYSESEDPRDNRTFTYRHDHLMRKFVVYPEQFPHNLAHFYHNNGSCLDFTPVVAPSFKKLEQEQRLRLFPNTRFHKYTHTATQEDLENTMAYMDIFQRILADDSIADQDFVVITHAHAQIMPAWRERANYLVDYVSYINPATQLIYLGLENYKNYISYTYDDFKNVGIISNVQSSAHLNEKVAQPQVRDYLELQFQTARKQGTLTPLEQTRYQQQEPAAWRISYLTSYRATQPLMFMIRKAAIAEKFGPALMRDEPLIGWWSYEMLIYLFNFEAFTTAILQPFWAQSSPHKDEVEAMQSLSYDLVQDQQLSTTGSFMSPVSDTSYTELLQAEVNERTLSFVRDEAGYACTLAACRTTSASSPSTPNPPPTTPQTPTPIAPTSAGANVPAVGQETPIQGTASAPALKPRKPRKANCARRAVDELTTQQPQQVTTSTATIKKRGSKNNASTNATSVAQAALLNDEQLQDQLLRELFVNHVCIGADTPATTTEQTIPTTQRWQQDPLLPRLPHSPDLNHEPTLFKLRSWQTSQLDEPVPLYQTFHGTPYLARFCPEYLHYQQLHPQAELSHAEVARAVQFAPPSSEQFTGNTMYQLLLETWTKTHAYVAAREACGLWRESPQPNTNQQHESARAFTGQTNATSEAAFANREQAGTSSKFAQALREQIPHCNATPSELHPAQRTSLARSCEPQVSDVQDVLPYRLSHPGLSTPLHNSTLSPQLRVARNGKLQGKHYQAFDSAQQRRNQVLRGVSNHGFDIKDYLATTPKFVINMLSNRERYAHFFAQPNTAGFTHFPAITGKDLTLEQRQELFDLEGFKTREGRYPTLGEIGCTLSHLQIYRQVMSDRSIPDDAWVLIAEDDVVLDADWYYKVNKYLHGLQYHSHLDILLLSQVYIKHTHTQPQDAFLKSNYIYSKPHYYQQLGSPKDQYLNALNLEAYRYIGKSTVDLPVGLGTLSYYKPCASSFYLIRKRALLHNRKLLLNKPFWYADSFQWVIKDTYFDNMAFSNPILAVQSAQLESAIEGERLAFEQAKRQELRKIDIESASDYLSVSNVYVVRLAGLSDAQILEKFSNAKIIDKVEYVGLPAEQQAQLFDKQAYAARYGSCDLSDAEIERQLSYFKACNAIVNNGMHSLQSNLVLPDALILSENFAYNYNLGMQYINTRMSLNTNCHILGAQCFDQFADRRTPYTRAELKEILNYEFASEDELRINGGFNYMHVKARKLFGAHSMSFIKFGLRGDVVGNYPISVDINDPASYMHLHHESVVFHNPPSCFLPSTKSQ